MRFKPGIPLLCVLLLSVAACQAGPLNRFDSDNNLRLDRRNDTFDDAFVCVIGDVLYRAGDPVPPTSPCQRCTCRPPGFACEPEPCELRPGCKALMMPDQCCPVYQCECERNGRVYQNGERLQSPDSPCDVCYCRGGEVSCTSIECYRRDDCEPQYVDGRCCPKYDHCPPLDQPRPDKTRPQHLRVSHTLQQRLDHEDLDREASEDVTATVLTTQNPTQSTVAEVTTDRIQPPEKITLKTESNSTTMASNTEGQDTVTDEKGGKTVEYTEILTLEPQRVSFISEETTETVMWEPKYVALISKDNPVTQRSEDDSAAGRTSAYSSSDEGSGAMTSHMTQSTESNITITKLHMDELSSDGSGMPQFEHLDVSPNNEELNVFTETTGRAISETTTESVESNEVVTDTTTTTTTANYQKDVHNVSFKQNIVPKDIGTTPQLDENNNKNDILPSEQIKTDNITKIENLGTEIMKESQVDIVTENPSEHMEKSGNEMNELSESKLPTESVPKSNDLDDDEKKTTPGGNELGTITEQISNPNDNDASITNAEIMKLFPTAPIVGLSDIIWDDEQDNTAASISSEYTTDSTVLPNHQETTSPDSSLEPTDKVPVELRKGNLELDENSKEESDGLSEYKVGMPSNRNSDYIKISTEADNVTTTTEEVQTYATSENPQLENESQINETSTSIVYVDKAVSAALEFKEMLDEENKEGSMILTDQETTTGYETQTGVDHEKLSGVIPTTHSQNDGSTTPANNENGKIVQGTVPVESGSSAVQVMVSVNDKAHPKTEINPVTEAVTFVNLEDGPPVLPIGADLANHEMDVVLATTEINAPVKQDGSTQTEKLFTDHTDNIIGELLTTRHVTDETVPITMVKFVTEIIPSTDSNVKVVEALTLHLGQNDSMVSNASELVQSDKEPSSRQTVPDTLISVEIMTTLNSAEGQTLGSIFYSDTSTIQPYTELEKPSDTMAADQSVKEDVIVQSTFDPTSPEKTNDHESSHNGMLGNTGMPKLFTNKQPVSVSVSDIFSPEKLTTEASELEEIITNTEGAEMDMLLKDYQTSSQTTNSEEPTTSQSANSEVSDQTEMLKLQFDENLLSQTTSETFSSEQITTLETEHSEVTGYTEEPQPSTTLLGNSHIYQTASDKSSSDESTMQLDELTTYSSDTIVPLDSETPTVKDITSSELITTEESEQGEISGHTTLLTESLVCLLSSKTSRSDESTTQQYIEELTTYSSDTIVPLASETQTMKDITSSELSTNEQTKDNQASEHTTLSTESLMHQSTPETSSLEDSTTIQPVEEVTTNSLDTIVPTASGTSNMDEKVELKSFGQDETDTSIGEQATTEQQEQDEDTGYNEALTSSITLLDDSSIHQKTLETSSLDEFATEQSVEELITYSSYAIVPETSETSTTENIDSSELTTTEQSKQGDVSGHTSLSTEFRIQQSASETSSVEDSTTQHSVDEVTTDHLNTIVSVDSGSSGTNKVTTSFGLYGTETSSSEQGEVSEHIETSTQEFLIHQSASESSSTDETTTQQFNEESTGNSLDAFVPIAYGTSNVNEKIVLKSFEQDETNVPISKHTTTGQQQQDFVTEHNKALTASPTLLDDSTIHQKTPDTSSSNGSTTRSVEEVATNSPDAVVPVVSGSSNVNKVINMKPVGQEKNVDNTQIVKHGAQFKSEVVTQTKSESETVTLPQEWLKTDCVSEHTVIPPSNIGITGKDIPVVITLSPMQDKNHSVQHIPTPEEIAAVTMVTKHGEVSAAANTLDGGNSSHAESSVKQDALNSVTTLNGTESAMLVTTDPVFQFQDAGDIEQGNEFVYKKHVANIHAINGFGIPVNSYSHVPTDDYNPNNSKNFPILDDFFTRLFISNEPHKAEDTTII